MVRSNVTEMRIRTLVLAGLFAVGLLREAFRCWPETRVPLRAQAPGRKPEA